MKDFRKYTLEDIIHLFESGKGTAADRAQIKELLKEARSDHTTISFSIPEKLAKRIRNYLYWSKDVIYADFFCSLLLPEIERLEQENGGPYEEAPKGHLAALKSKSGRPKQHV